MPARSALMSSCASIRSMAACPSGSAPSRMPRICQKSALVCRASSVGMAAVERGIDVGADTRGDQRVGAGERGEFYGLPVSRSRAPARRRPDTTRRGATPPPAPQPRRPHSPLERSVRAQTRQPPRAHRRQARPESWRGPSRKRRGRAGRSARPCARWSRSGASRSQLSRQPPISWIISSGRPPAPSARARSATPSPSIHRVADIGSGILGYVRIGFA